MQSDLPSNRANLTTWLRIPIQNYYCIFDDCNQLSINSLVNDIYFSFPRELLTVNDLSILLIDQWMYMGILLGIEYYTMVILWYCCLMVFFWHTKHSKSLPSFVLKITWKPDMKLTTYILRGCTKCLHGSGRRIMSTNVNNPIMPAG